MSGIGPNRNAEQVMVIGGFFAHFGLSPTIGFSSHPARADPGVPSQSTVGFAQP
jgi:hypothetical protein